MPDQSAAAAEHAIMRDVTLPMPVVPDDPVSIAADVDFPLALRGYERGAVDAYVRRTSQLVAELHTMRSPDLAVRRALERVGEEVAGLLRRAHETAESIAAQSRVDAEERIERARVEAQRITAAAERRLVELDSEADRLWAERHRIVDDARALAQELLDVADSALGRVPAPSDGAVTTSHGAVPSDGDMASDGAVAGDEAVASDEAAADAGSADAKKGGANPKAESAVASAGPKVRRAGGREDGSSGS